MGRFRLDLGPTSRAIAAAALAMLVSSCTVKADYSAEGFACSAQDPCPSGFSCDMNICVAGAPQPDGPPPIPDAGADAMTVVCLPPIALSDEFPGDAVDVLQWTVSDGGGATAVVGGGVLTLTPRPMFAQPKYAAIRSAAFALDGKRVFAEFPAMVDSTTIAVGELRLGTLPDTFYFIRQSQGILQFGTSVAGAELVVSVTDYEPANHRWWQMRMTGGRVHADVSSAGSTWVNLDSVAADVITGDLFVELSAGTQVSVTAPGAMQVDNVNSGSGLCL